MKKLVTFLIVISMLLGACNTQPSIQVEYTCPRMYQYIEDLRVDLGEYGVFKPYCYLGKYPKLVLTIPLLEAPAEGTPPSEWKLDYSAPNIVKRGSKNIYELLLDGGEIKFKMPASGLVTLRYGGTGGDKFKVFVSGREWDNLKYWTFFSKPGTEDFIIGKDKKVKILVLPREEILESMYYNSSHV